MVDVTGGDPPIGSSEFNPPLHFDEVYKHFGDPEMFAVANAAALPASDNWPGRMLMTQDTGFVYRWTGAAWKVVAGDAVATLTPASGITLTHRVNRIGNLISFDVSASKATDMGTNETVTTLPADFRPVNNITGGLHLSSALAFIGAFGSVLNTGEVKVNALGAAGVRNVFFNLTWVRDS